MKVLFVPKRDNTKSEYLNTANILRFAMSPSAIISFLVDFFSEEYIQLPQNHVIRIEIINKVVNEEFNDV